MRRYACNDGTLQIRIRHISWFLKVEAKIFAGFGIWTKRDFADCNVITFWGIVHIRRSVNTVTMFLIWFLSSTQHLDWRISFGVESLRDWTPPEVFLKYWPGGIYGVDKQGHPILYQLSNGFDAQGMCICCYVAPQYDAGKCYCVTLNKLWNY